MTTVHLENVSDFNNIPKDEDVTRWVENTLNSLTSGGEKNKGNRESDAELSIRIVNSNESQELNNQYRHKEKPTNVLSFPCDLPSEIDIPLLGDLVICAELVHKEALEQDKTTMAHWAHLVVHGTLHLCGYDHIDENEAEEMEALEVSILKNLGFNNPYVTLTNDQQLSKMELNGPNV